MNRIVETLDQLDDGTLPAPRGPNKRDMGTRFDLDVEVPEDANARTRRIAEVDVLELDAAFALGQGEAIGRFSVDFGLVVQQSEDRARS